jgi:hypothetical protein
VLLCAATLPADAAARLTSRKGNKKKVKRALAKLDEGEDEDVVFQWFISSVGGECWEGGVGEGGVEGGGSVLKGTEVVKAGVRAD